MLDHDAAAIVAANISSASSPPKRTAHLVDELIGILAMFPSGVPLKSTEPRWIPMKKDGYKRKPSDTQ